MGNDIRVRSFSKARLVAQGTFPDLYNVLFASLISKVIGSQFLVVRAGLFVARDCGNSCVVRVSIGRQDSAGF
jgi:hypothetical protein